MLIFKTYLKVQILARILISIVFVNESVIMFSVSEGSWYINLNEMFGFYFWCFVEI